MLVSFMVCFIGVKSPSFPSEGVDEHRTKVLNRYGIEVVRYTNEEILNHFEDLEMDLRDKREE